MAAYLCVSATNDSICLRVETQVIPQSVLVCFFLSLYHTVDFRQRYGFLISCALTLTHKKRKNTAKHC